MIKDLFWNIIVVFIFTHKMHCFWVIHYEKKFWEIEKIVISSIQVCRITETLLYMKLFNFMICSPKFEWFHFIGLFISYNDLIQVKTSKMQYNRKLNRHQENIIELSSDNSFIALQIFMKILKRIEKVSLYPCIHWRISFEYYIYLFSHSSTFLKYWRWN